MSYKRHEVDELLEKISVGDTKDLTPYQEEIIEEALSLFITFHSLMQQGGVSVGDEMSSDDMVQFFDSSLGELCAACIFLSEDVFEQAPKILRSIPSAIDKVDVDFKDDQGVSGPSVPNVVKNGFSRLADRIEATKVQKHNYNKIFEEHQRSKEK